MAKSRQANAAKGKAAKAKAKPTAKGGKQNSRGGGKAKKNGSGAEKTSATTTAKKKKLTLREKKIEEWWTIDDSIFVEECEVGGDGVGNDAGAASVRGNDANGNDENGNDANGSGGGRIDNGSGGGRIDTAGSNDDANGNNDHNAKGSTKAKIPAKPVSGAAAIVSAFWNDFHNEYDNVLGVEKTKGAIVAYRQFLIMKKEAKDWGGEKLAPCLLVDCMWDIHSKMPSYDEDTKLLCGRSVPYVCRLNGLDDDAPEAWKLREQATIQACLDRFGEEFNEGVWNIVGVFVNGLQDENGSDDDDDTIPYYLCDKRVPLSGMLERFAEEQNISLKDYHFSYDRHQIDGAVDTPLDLGYCNDDAIEVLHKDEVRIIVRDMSADDKTSICETIYCHTVNDMLHHLMVAHAAKLEMETSDFVFLYNEKKLYGHQYTRDLKGIGNYSTIDVFHVDEYKHKCENCICCNVNDDIIKLG